jgi:hypothetical protein
VDRALKSECWAESNEGVKVASHVQVALLRVRVLRVDERIDAKLLEVVVHQVRVGVFLVEPACKAHPNGLVGAQQCPVDAIKQKQEHGRIAQNAILHSVHVFEWPILKNVGQLQVKVSSRDAAPGPRHHQCDSDDPGL